MHRATTLFATTLLLVACSGGSKPAPDAPAPAQSAATSQPTSQPSQPGAQPNTQPAAQPAGAPSGPGSVGGVTYQANEPLRSRPPSSQMRAAEYVVAGDAGEAELTVYYFGPGQGGSVQANLDRWIGQITQPDGSDSRAIANIAERTVAGLKITTLDVSGTYDGGMAPMMQQQAAGPMTDHRMLGAIAEGPQGPVFFKLVGPQATLASAEPAFAALVESVRPAGN